MKFYTFTNLYVINYFWLITIFPLVVGNNGSSFLWKSAIFNGFFAYITTAYETTATAKIVFQCNGIPKSKKLKIAVKINSNADANALSIEFKFLRNNEVTIPTKELLIIIAITKNCKIFVKDPGVKLIVSSDLYVSINMLHKIESKYM